MITQDPEGQGCRGDPLPLPAGGLDEPGLLGHGGHGFVQEGVGLDEAQRGIGKVVGGSVPRGLANPSTAARSAGDRRQERDGRAWQADFLPASKRSLKMLRTRNFCSGYEEAADDPWWPPRPHVTKGMNEAIHFHLGLHPSSKSVFSIFSNSAPRLLKASFHEPVTQEV